jgi:hypothetical protein
LDELSFFSASATRASAFCSFSLIVADKLARCYRTGKFFNLTSGKQAELGVF